MADTLEERHVLIRVTGDARVVEAYNRISQTGDRSMQRVEKSTHGAARAMDTLAAAGRRAFGTLTRDAALFAATAMKTFAMASAAAAGFFAAASARAAVQRDSQLRALNSLMGQADTARRHFRDLQQDALLPGVTLDAALELSIRLQSVGMQAEFARKAIVEVGNAIALSGGTDEALSRASLALQQIIASPALQGDELRQLADAVPQVRKVLVDAFGTASTEQIAKFGLTTQEMVAIIVEGLSKLERADPTAKANQLVNVTAAIKELFVAFGEGLTGNEAMASLNGFATVVQALIPMARTAGVAVGKLFDPANITAGLEAIIAVAAAVGNFGSHAADVTRILWATLVNLTRAFLNIGRDGVAVAAAVVKAWSQVAFSLPRMLFAVGSAAVKAFGMAWDAAKFAAGAIGKLFTGASGVVTGAFHALTTAVRDAISATLRPLMEWWAPARRAWEEMQAAGRDIASQWDQAKAAVEQAGQDMQAALDENSRQWGAWQAEQNAVIEQWFRQATATDAATAALARNTAAAASNATAQAALARAAAETDRSRVQAVGVARTAGQAALANLRRLEANAAATMDPQVRRQFADAQAIARRRTAEETLPGENLTEAERGQRYTRNLSAAWGRMQVSTRDSDRAIARVEAEIESLDRQRDGATPAVKAALDQEIQARRDNVAAMKAQQEANTARYAEQSDRFQRLLDDAERFFELASKREQSAREAAELQEQMVGVGIADDVAAAEEAAARASAVQVEQARRITMSVTGTGAGSRREGTTDAVTASVLAGGGATDTGTILAEARLRQGYDLVKSTVYDSVGGLLRVVSTAIKDGVDQAVSRSRLATQSALRGAT